MRSTLKLTALSTLTALAVTVSGCNDSTGRMQQENPTPSPQPNPNPNPNPNPDPDPMMNPDPAPQPTPAPTANYSGVYEVVAPWDFTQNGVLPGMVGPLLGGLSDLHDHPGKALYTILENANIPYISDIMMNLPGFVVSGLEALLDDLITKNLYQGYPLVDQIAGIIQGIAEVTKTMDVHDTITVHKPDASMTSKIDQQLTAIDFKLLGSVQTVKFPSNKLPAALSHMNGHLTPHTNAPVADADISMEDGTFSIPIGNMMLQALGPLLFNQFGGATDLLGALKNMVPCADFGQQIVDWASPAVTDPQIGKDLCEGALGIVAQAIQAPIEALSLDNVKAELTNGKLYDVSMKAPKQDYQADRLAEGKWTWHFDVSGGTADVPSSFMGDRTGTAN